MTSRRRTAWTGSFATRRRRRRSSIALRRRCATSNAANWKAELVHDEKFQADEDPVYYTPEAPTLPLTKQAGSVDAFKKSILEADRELDERVDRLRRTSKAIEEHRAQGKAR
jgi:hypothetical protein